MDNDVCVGYTPQGECMREIPPKRMLAIFAHPDDESFTAGGMLAKYAHEGVRVVLLCLTRGETGIPGMPPKFAGPIRTSEMRRAEEQLGIETYIYSYNDGELARMDTGLLLETISTWIDMVQPQVIVTFGLEGASGHPDHIVVSKLVTQVYDRCYRKGILISIQPSEATALGCGVESNPIDPSMKIIKIDITDFKLYKFLAIKSHASQKPDLPNNKEEAMEKIPCYELYSIARNIKNSDINTDWFEQGIEVVVDAKA
jgi:LmbE family N-acetylglucosaminyl deacetylase